MPPYSREFLFLACHAKEDGRQRDESWSCGETSPGLASALQRAHTHTCTYTHTHTLDTQSCKLSCNPAHTSVGVGSGGQGWERLAVLTRWPAPRMNVISPGTISRAVSFTHLPLPSPPPLLANMPSAAADVDTVSSGHRFPEKKNSYKKTKQKKLIIKGQHKKKAMTCVSVRVCLVRMCVHLWKLVCGRTRSSSILSLPLFLCFLPLMSTQIKAKSCLADK